MGSSEYLTRFFERGYVTGAEKEMLKGHVERHSTDAAFESLTAFGVPFGQTVDFEAAAHMGVDQVAELLDKKARGDAGTRHELPRIDAALEDALDPLARTPVDAALTLWILWRVPP